MDNNKIKQAIEIIAREVSKLPANTLMDHGTFGSTIGSTKREGEANKMAKYFLSQMGRQLPEPRLGVKFTTEERATLDLVKEMTAAVFSIVEK